MYRMGNAYVYRCAIHMHTTHSDGTKPVDALTAIAAETGLDCIMVTDHMTLAARDEGRAGWHGSVLTIIGYEHNDPADTHHFLVFGSPAVYPPSLSAADYVKRSAADNALTVIAHPDEVRASMKKYPPYPWTDWSVADFSGLELWNQMSEWTEKLTPYNKLPMALSPRKSLVGPAKRTVQRWDELNRKRRYAGIASVDAHAFPIQFGPWQLEIFPYKVHFRCLQTHLILDEPLSSDGKEATKQVYAAIRACRIVFCNVRWGDVEGSVAHVRQGGRVFYPGDQLSLQDGQATLELSLPMAGSIRLFHDGRLSAEAEGSAIDLSLKAAGLYRIEVWRDRRGWYFTNHFRVVT